MEEKLCGSQERRVGRKRRRGSLIIERTAGDIFLYIQQEGAADLCSKKEVMIVEERRNCKGKKLLTLSPPYP